MPVSAGLEERVRTCHGCPAEECVLLEAVQENGSAPSLLRAMTLHRYQARQTLFYEGAPAHTVYLLAHGEVKLSVVRSSGTSRIVQILSPARASCEMLDRASLGGGVHLMTCETLTPCQVHCIATTELAWLAQRHHGLASRLLSAATAENAILLQHLKDDLAIQARKRLVKVLVNLADRYGVSGVRGIELNLALRRQEWAECVGTSRETVARLLNDLKREGLLCLTGRRITILHYDRLARLAL